MSKAGGVGLIKLLFDNKEIIPVQLYTVLQAMLLKFPPPLRFGTTTEVSTYSPI
jgi:hypothetical protein